MTKKEFPPQLTLAPAAHAEGIVPLPGSKSISNRTLLLAALAQGTTTLTGLLESDDTRVMLDALRALGIAWRETGAQRYDVPGAGGPFPVKHADLWQRVDRALQFHEVDCRTIRIDRPSDDLSRPLPPSLVTRPRATAADDPMPTPLAGPARRGRPLVRRVGHVVRSTLRCLFGWCGLCRTRSALLIAAH